MKMDEATSREDRVFNVYPIVRQIVRNVDPGVNDFDRFLALRMLNKTFYAAVEHFLRVNFTMLQCVNEPGADWIINGFHIKRAKIVKFVRLLKVAGVKLRNLQFSNKRPVMFSNNALAEVELHEQLMENVADMLDNSVMCFENAYYTCTTGCRMCVTVAAHTTDVYGPLQINVFKQGATINCRYIKIYQTAMDDIADWSIGRSRPATMANLKQNIGHNVKCEVMQFRRQDAQYAGTHPEIMPLDVLRILVEHCNPNTVRLKICSTFFPESRPFWPRSEHFSQVRNIADGGEAERFGYDFAMRKRILVVDASQSVAVAFRIATAFTDDETRGLNFPRMLPLSSYTIRPPPTRLTSANFTRYLTHLVGWNWPVTRGEKTVVLASVTFTDDVALNLAYLEAVLPNAVQGRFPARQLRYWYDGQHRGLELRDKGMQQFALCFVDDASDSMVLVKVTVVAFDRLNQRFYDIRNWTNSAAEEHLRQTTEISARMLRCHMTAEQNNAERMQAMQARITQLRQDMAEMRRNSEE